MATPRRYFTFKPGQAPAGRQKDQLTLRAGMSAAFAPGRGYYARPKSRTQPRTTAQDATGAAAPMSLPDQASSLAESLLRPQANYLSQAAEERARRGTEAIKGYTSSLASAFAAQDFAAPYQSAISDQAAVDQALREAVTGAGSQAADQLRQRLAAGGVDPAAVEAAAGQARQVGQGSGALAVGLGSAELGRLVANRAAAETYGGKLPGIASLSGVQDVAALQGQVGADLQDQLGQLAARQPELAYGILQDLQAAKAKAAQQQAELEFKQQQAADLRAYRDEQLKLKRQGALTDLGYKQALLEFKRGQQADLNAYRQGQLALGQQRVDTSRAKASKAKAKVSVKDVRDARGYLDKAAKGYYASVSDSSTPLTTSQLQAIAKDAGMTLGTLLQVEDPEALAGLGVGYVKVDPAEPSVDPKTGKPTGRDDKIQRLYLTLVRKYGIPARQAFQMVAGIYKDWGEKRRSSYFPGKAAAAAETAAYVTEAANADRAGVSTQPAVLDFVGRVGQIAGKRLTISTGSRHSQFVAGTRRESAHWTGRAADIPASGGELTRLGQAALIAAGMPPEQARKIRGGLFNVGGHQIIFNTDEGGNHFNHLHVGLRGTV